MHQVSGPYLGAYGVPPDAEIVTGDQKSRDSFRSSPQS
jgi:hypothetical protein